MKVSELLKSVDLGWVQKPKGFRVHFQQLTDSGPVTDYVPAEDESLFDSDVVAWRSAWKLWQVSQSDHPEMGNGKLVNIYVVDEAGNQVKYYATNQYDVFNPDPSRNKADEG